MIPAFYPKGKKAGIFLNMPRMKLDFSHILPKNKVRIQEKFPEQPHLKPHY